MYLKFENVLMTTIFDGYVTKENAEELAKMMLCSASVRSESYC